MVARSGNIRARIWVNRSGGEIRPRIDITALRGSGGGGYSSSFTPDELWDVARVALHAKRWLRKRQRWSAIRRFMWWWL